MSHVIAQSFELGAIRKTHISADHEGVVEELVQDCAPILDMNKRFQNGDRPETPFDGLAQKVAAIPMVVAEHWQKVHGVNVLNKADMPKVMALLNRPEWKYLKTVDEVL